MTTETDYTGIAVVIVIILIVIVSLCIPWIESALKLHEEKRHDQDGDTGW